jgi:hypothetical protein
MRVRRLWLVLALAAAAGLSAACGSDAGSGAKAGSTASAGGAPAGSSAAPSTAGGGASGTPGAAGKASTEEVCKAVVAALDKEKLEIAAVALEMATAEAGDQAAKTKAQEKANALIARLTKAVNAETAKAADPKVKAALDGFVANVAKILTPQGVADPDFESKFAKAADEAAAYCPALKG